MQYNIKKGKQYKNRHTEKSLQYTEGINFRLYPTVQVYNATLLINKVQLSDGHLQAYRMGIKKVNTPIIINNIVHKYPTRTRHNVKIPSIKTTIYGQHGIYYKATHYFNELPLLSISHCNSYWEIIPYYFCSLLQGLYPLDIFVK